jgi:hypothetical protein
MAGLLEYDRLWTFTSTGAGAWEDAYHAREHGFLLETVAGTTATITIEHRRKNSTITALIGAASNLDASSMVTVAYTGTLYQVRPRVTDMTSTGTVYVQGVGNS